MTTEQPPTPSLDTQDDPEPDRWPTRYTTLALEQLSGGVPYPIAEAALALIEGDLAAHPYRVSKALQEPLDGLRSARSAPTTASSCTLTRKPPSSWSSTSTAAPASTAPARQQDGGETNASAAASTRERPGRRRWPLRNEQFVRYALSASSAPLAVAVYTYETLPAEARAGLPSAAPLAAALDISTLPRRDTTEAR